MFISAMSSFSLFLFVLFCSSSRKREVRATYGEGVLSFFSLFFEFRDS